MECEYSEKVFRANHCHRMDSNGCIVYCETAVCGNHDMVLRAYSNIENAKKIADENAAEGYKVFNSAGQIVYTPEIKQESEKPEPSKPEPSEPVDYSTHTYIVGNYEYSDDVIVKVVKAVEENNKEFDTSIAKAFFNIAPKYGISPLYAIAQSVLETGWFKFEGSSVKPEQHNYCGLGATGGGVSGASFDTIEKGVEAQLRHLGE